MLPYKDGTSTPLCMLMKGKHDIIQNKTSPKANMMLPRGYNWGREVQKKKKSWGMKVPKEKQIALKLKLYNLKTINKYTFVKEPKKLLCVLRYMNPDLTRIDASKR